jgi:hypothetical protein
MSSKGMAELSLPGMKDEKKRLVAGLCVVICG